MVGISFLRLDNLIRLKSDLPASGADQRRVWMQLLAGDLRRIPSNDHLKQRSRAKQPGKEESHRPPAHHLLLLFSVQIVLSPRCPRSAFCPATMSSFDVLCGVEVQLCFHYCALGDLLRLARCSHRLYALAEQPFSMKFALLRLSLRNLRDDPVGGISLRIKPQLHLICGTALTTIEVDRAIALASVLPCHTLDASNVNRISTPLLFRLIASPCLASLQCFLMHRDVTPSWNADAAAMEQLSRLPRVRSMSLTPRSDSFEGWKSLSAFPALTRLDVEDTFTAWTVSSMMEIAKCGSLEQLHIRTPSLYGERFGRVLGAAPLRSLLSLSLDTLFTNGILMSRSPAIRPADYVAAFTNLSNLTSLGLCCIYQIDSMLMHVHLASALKRLEVQPDCTLRSTQRASLPSSSVMKQLLTTLPHLQCTVRLDGRAGPQLQDASLTLCSDLAEFESQVLGTPTRVHLALPMV